MRTLSFFLFTAALGLIVGCAGPSQRIEKHPALYDPLPDDVKAKVSQGQIEVGFSADAVFLSLGKPDRKYTRETAEGTTIVQSWVSHEYHTDRQRVSARFKVRDNDGRLRTAQDDVWVDVRQSREYETKRVEIRNNQVVAIEEITR